MRSSTPAWLLLGLGSLCFVTVGACARVAPQTNVMAGSGGSGGSSRPGTDGGVRPDREPSNIPMQCGDGVRTEDEACDDGNTMSERRLLVGLPHGRPGLFLQSRSVSPVTASRAVATACW